MATPTFTITDEYAFVVTHDHLARKGETNRVGVVGPRWANDELVARLQAGEGRKWRTYDDDGERVYDGLWIGDGWDDPELHLPEEAFSPLDCFAGPDAGATEIHYLDDGKWVQL